MPGWSLEKSSLALLAGFPLLVSVFAALSHLSLPVSPVMAAVLVVAVAATTAPMAMALVRARDANEFYAGEAVEAARHDPLSGLPNRTTFAEELAALLTANPGRQVALVYVDLDGFKSINDNYNHETGDSLLKAVAGGFEALAGDSMRVARLGGDEFAFMLSGESVRKRAEALSAHILAFVKEPFDIGGKEAVIGANIGMAETGEGGVDAAELMRRAEAATRDAKSHGHNQRRWFDAALDAKRIEEFDIAREMRSFIAHNAFEVEYQPIVDSVTRRIEAVEALARWPKASARRLTPDHFIPIAEEHGLIGDLGNLILAKACRDLSQWQELRLSVNVSPVQLNNRAFTRTIERIVRQCGFALDRLEVEFTETALIHNTERARDVINELHAHGVTVALDDFGTGFASVGYLRTFHFDKVKLDKSLTQSILTNVAAQKVVQGTVLIADGLAAAIIAEGIESEEEAQLLRLSGCHQLQGHYFGRPQTAETLRTIVPRIAEHQRLRAVG
jgi:diguanylate cyclase (GGDEF)-like protein